MTTELLVLEHPPVKRTQPVRFGQDVCQLGIERIKRLEAQGTGAKILVGLELSRWKLRLGYGNFIPFVMKCELLPWTAERRMRLAEDFCEWAQGQGLLSKIAGEPLTNEAIQLLENKFHILQNFNCSRFDKQEFLREIDAEQTPEFESDNSMSFLCARWLGDSANIVKQMSRKAKVMRGYSIREYLKLSKNPSGGYETWSEQDRQYFRDCIFNIKSQFLALDCIIQDLDDKLAGREKRMEGVQIPFMDLWKK